MQVQLVERDGVAHFQAGGVSSPATLIRGVQKTVAQEDEVSRSNSFPGDLLELSLLQQLSSRSYEFPVTKASLELEHCLELILIKIKSNYVKSEGSWSYPLLHGIIGMFRSVTNNLES